MRQRAEGRERLPSLHACAPDRGDLRFEQRDPAAPIRMGRAAEEIEAPLPEARPEADRGLGIVTRPFEQVDAEPVGLDLGLADPRRVATEIAEEAARDLGRVEPDAMAEDVVSEFVRE